jgi:hypothetical protein
VDYLCTKFWQDTSVGIAYISFDFKRNHKQTLESLFASLLKQFVKEQSCVPDSVKVLYTWYKDNRRRVTFDEMSEVLHSVVECCSKTLTSSTHLINAKWVMSAKRDFFQGYSFSRRSVGGAFSSHLDIFLRYQKYSSGAYHWKYALRVKMCEDT